MNLNKIWSLFLLTEQYFLIYKYLIQETVENE